jgi:hypothetical protein
MAISRISLSLATAALALAGGIAAAKNPMVGGAAMYETKTIVENAANSRSLHRPTPPSPSFPPAQSIRCSSPRTRRC